MVWEKILDSIRKISENKRLISGLILFSIVLLIYASIFANPDQLHKQLAYVFPTIVMLAGVGIPIIISALNYDDHDFSDIIDKLKSFICVAIVAVILDVVLYLSYGATPNQKLNDFLLMIWAFFEQYGMNVGYAAFIVIYILLIFLFFDIVRNVAKIYFGSNLERHAKRFKRYAEGNDDDELKNLIQAIIETITKMDEIKLREISPIIDGLMDLDGDDDGMLKLVFPVSSETSDSMLELIYGKINNDEKFIKSILEQLHDLDKVGSCNDRTLSYFMCGIKHLAFGDDQKIKIINDYMCEIIENEGRDKAFMPPKDINRHENAEKFSHQTNFITSDNLNNKINFTRVLPHILLSESLCSLCHILEGSKGEMARFACKLLRNEKVFGMLKDKNNRYNIDSTVEFLLTKGDPKLLKEKCYVDLIALSKIRIELIPEDLRKCLHVPSISDDEELQVKSKVDYSQSDLNKPSV